MSQQKYAQIINLPHHVSSKRPRMSMRERAAQFSPFAALSGYDAAIKKAALLSAIRPELDEQEKDSIGSLLKEAANTRREIEIQRFVPGEEESANKIACMRGVIQKIDAYTGTVLFTDNTKIALEDILDVKLL